MNQHHRQVFTATYPNVAAEINGVALYAFSPRRQSAWLPDMQLMARFNPETRETIIRLFMDPVVKG